MTKTKISPTAAKLLQEYSALDRDIRALSWLLVCLIAASASFAVWAILMSDVASIWRLAQIVGVLISALIISKSASRLLCHTELSRQQDRERSVVRLTHHAMAIIQDLKQRLVFARELLKNQGVSGPQGTLRSIARSIDSHYQSFYDRDLYELMSPKAIKLIAGMSGTVFGLLTFAEGFQQGPFAEAIIPSGEPIPGSEELISSLDVLIDDVEQLDEEFREARSSIQG